MNDCAVDITGWVTFRCPRCGNESHYPPDQVPLPPLCMHLDEPCEMEQTLEPVS